MNPLGLNLIEQGLIIGRSTGTHTHALNTQTTPFESSFYSCSVYSE